MAYLTTVGLDNPELPLAETLGRLDDPSFAVQYVDRPDNGPPIACVLAHDRTGVGELNRALAADAGVHDHRILIDGDRRRLFKVALREETLGFTTEVASRPLSVVGARSGGNHLWSLDLQGSDRESIVSLRRCVDRGLDFTVRSVTEIDEPVSHRDHSALEYALTGPQRELLVRAFEEGYFAIPRSITLSELARSAGITPNSASARLRRGVSNLIRSTGDFGSTSPR